MGKKSKYVSVRIPRDLRDKLKEHAVREDRIVQRLIVRAIAEYLNRNERAPRG